MASESEYAPTLLDPGPADPGRGDRIARWIVWPLLSAFLLVILLAYVIFVPFRVDGESMEPGLHNNDRVFRTKTYDAPHRGDVIVYHDQQGDRLVKRIAAVAGDTIEIRDDVAIVNGVVQSGFLVAVAPGYGVNRPPVKVPPGAVYLLGDNRPVSDDSRFFGPVPEANVQGKVVLRFAPITRFGPVH